MEIVVLLRLISDFILIGSEFQSCGPEYTKLSLYKVVRYCRHTKSTPKPLFEYVLVTKLNSLLLDVPVRFLNIHSNKKYLCTLICFCILCVEHIFTDLTM